eukprot:m.646977 g.646977  ORF g.646977 m.646977 type:complete len:317 (-) comp22653_c0_seq2:1365-2315(-)
MLIRKSVSQFLCEACNNVFICCITSNVLVFVVVKRCTGVVVVTIQLNTSHCAPHRSKSSLVPRVPFGVSPPWYAYAESHEVQVRCGNKMAIAHVVQVVWLGILEGCHTSGARGHCRATFGPVRVFPASRVLRQRVRLDKVHWKRIAAGCQRFEHFCQTRSAKRHRFVCGQRHARELREGWHQVDQLSKEILKNERRSFDTCRVTAVGTRMCGIADDERDSHCHFKHRHLAVHVVLSKLPAMIRDECDDRIFLDAQCIHRIKNTSDLRIHKRYCCIIREAIRLCGIRRQRYIPLRRKPWPWHCMPCNWRHSHRCLWM